MRPSNPPLELECQMYNEARFSQHLTPGTFRRHRVYQKRSAFAFFRIRFTLRASIIHHSTSTHLGHFVLQILYSVWFVNDGPLPRSRVAR